MRIIANEGGVASKQNLHIGNPHNDLSVRQAAEIMLETRAPWTAYAAAAARVQLVDVSATKYYGGLSGCTKPRALDRPIPRRSLSGRRAST